MIDLESKLQPKNAVIHRWILAIFILVYLTIAPILIMFNNTSSIAISTQSEATNSSYPRNGSFLFELAKYPLEDALKAVQENDEKLVDQYTSSMFYHLLPFIIKEPPVKIDESCRGPEFSMFDCDLLPRIFNGTRQENAKIAVGFKFGFEADVLEIALNQYYEIVDKVFLFEATRTHLRRNKKPLVWERLQMQSRFKKFREMVVHLIVDDAPVSHDDYGNIWTFERFQDDQLFARINEWNKGTKHFSESDVLMLGDLDEIPSSTVLNTIKSCRFNNNTTTISTAIWFPFGNINYAFRPDWPALDAKSDKVFNYSLNAPHFWTFKAAAEYESSHKQIPRRIAGSKHPALLGGMHMTQYNYVPYFITKMSSISETGGKFKQILEYLKEAIQTNNLTRLEFEFPDPRKYYSDRIVNVTDVPNEQREIISIPWFLQCNLDRYPGWSGIPDPRLL